MSGLRALRLAKPPARFGLTLTVLTGVAVGTVGFPVTPPDLGRAGAFPCQGHGCGCHTAEQCWFGCCCLTAAQRLDWAKRHGVTPPEGVALLAEAEERTQAATPDLCCAPAACCKSDAKPSCCAGGKHSCCSQNAAPAKLAKRPGKSKDSGHPVVSCPQCRGSLGQWWVAGQPLALPERPVAVAPPGGSEAVVASIVLYTSSLAPPDARPG